MSVVLVIQFFYENTINGASFDHIEANVQLFFPSLKLENWRRVAADSRLLYNFNTTNMTFFHKLYIFLYAICYAIIHTFL